MKAKIFKLSMAFIFALVFCSVADDPDGTKFWGWDTFNHDIVASDKCASGYAEVTIEYYRVFWISTGIRRKNTTCLEMP